MKIFVVTLLFCVANALNPEESREQTSFPLPPHEGKSSQQELTEEQKEMLKPYKEACIAELKLDEAFIEKAKKQYKEEGKVDLDENMSCFSACMFKKIGFMNEEGKFDEEMVRALTADQLPEDQLDATIGACKDEAGKNDCETAGKLVACFLKQGIAVNS